jgi:hypothetical protein
VLGSFVFVSYSWSSVLVAEARLVVPSERLVVCSGALYLVLLTELLGACSWAAHLGVRAVLSRVLYSVSRAGRLAV